MWGDLVSLQPDSRQKVMERKEDQVMVLYGVEKIGLGL